MYFILQAKESLKQAIAFNRNDLSYIMLGKIYLMEGDIHNGDWRVQKSNWVSVSLHKHSQNFFVFQFITGPILGDFIIEILCEEFTLVSFRFSAENPELLTTIGLLYMQVSILAGISGQYPYIPIHIERFCLRLQFFFLYFLYLYLYSWLR